MRGVDARLVLEAADELVLGLLRSEAGDLLEPGALLGRQPVATSTSLTATSFSRRRPGRARAPTSSVALVELVEPLVEAVFLLGEPALESLELAAPLARRGLELGARLKQLLLGRELALFQPGVGIAPRLVLEARRLALRLSQPACALLADPAPT